MRCAFLLVFILLYHQMYSTSFVVCRVCWVTTLTKIKNVDMRFYFFCYKRRLVTILRLLRYSQKVHTKLIATFWTSFGRSPLSPPPPFRIPCSSCLGNACVAELSVAILRALQKIIAIDYCSMLLLCVT